jgi:hypothetical protein
MKPMSVTVAAIALSIAHSRARSMLPNSSSTPRPSPSNCPTRSIGNGTPPAPTKWPSFTAIPRDPASKCSCSNGCPENMSRPHWHPNDRIITVIKGTWWLGTGNKFEPDTTVPVPTGSTVIHYGKEVHYDGAKDVEVWLLMSGEGPETATPASTQPPAH